MFSKEAEEVCQDPSGRFFRFSVSPESVFVLEKKQLPSHLQSLDCVDSPTPVRDVLLQLEDSGEVPGE